MLSACLSRIIAGSIADKVDADLAAIPKTTDSGEQPATRNPGQSFIVSAVCAVSSACMAMADVLVDALLKI